MFNYYTPSYCYITNRTSILQEDMFKIKRVYEVPAAGDGYRVLVDRLWPRGMTKERAAMDYWLKDIAPSTELRKWFAHDPAKFHEFSVRYASELAHNPGVKTLLRLNDEHANVTLVYAAKDTQINHAIVLKDFLSNK